MRIISVNTLREFWEQPGHADAKQALQTWIKATKTAGWITPADVKKTFSTADVLKSGRMVFNIGGNKYRMVAKINYGTQIIYIRFIGTHRQYDQIDANEV